MALITCPECGKQVSSEAKTCIHCGYPINQEVIVNERVINSNALPSANFQSASTIPEKGKPKTKVLVIALVLILALAVVYVSFTSSSSNINSLTFPYDLTPEMTQGQATQMMIDKGFKTDYTYGDSTYFFSREIFGYYTDLSDISMNHGKLFSVSHQYSDSRGFNYQNPGPKFEDIKQQLEKQYGTSRKENFLDGTVYVWDNGPYQLKLFYHISDVFRVSYFYLASRARN